MSSISLTYVKARQATSWYSGVNLPTNPVVMGYNNSSYYDQGALYSMSVSVTTGATINSVMFNIGNISGHGTSTTGVFALIYNYDPTNYFSNNTAPTPNVASGFKSATIYGDSGTSNIMVNVDNVNITTSGTYYVFITTNAYGGLDPFIRTASNVTCNITMETLPENPATSISISNALYMDTPVTISWSPYSSGYTYVLAYKFTDSGSNTTIVSGTSASSYQFTFPVSLSSLIPNSVSGNLLLAVATYKNGVQVGNICTANFTLSIPTSGRYPTGQGGLDGWVLAGYTTNSSSAYLQSLCIGGISTINVSIDTSKVTCSYNATIASVVATCNGVTRNNSGSLGTAVVGNNVVSVVVTDSRGYTLSFTQTFTGQNYSPPSFTSLTVIRCDSSGTESTSGTYYAVTPSVTHTTFSNQNTLTITTRWQIFGGTYSSPVTISNNVQCAAQGGGQITTDSSYLIEVAATDLLGGSSVQTRTLSSTSVFATFRLKNTGLGASFFSNFTNGIPNDLTLTDREVRVYGHVTIFDTDGLTTGTFNDHSFSGAMLCSVGNNSFDGIYNGNGDGAVISTDPASGQVATDGTANLFIKSWQGVGFVDGCTGRGIAAVVNCRNGDISSRGLITCNALLTRDIVNAQGGIYTPGHILANIGITANSPYGLHVQTSSSDGTRVSDAWIGVDANDSNDWCFIVPGHNGVANSSAYTLFSYTGVWYFPQWVNVNGRLKAQVLNCSTASSYGTGTPSGGSAGDLYFQYS